MKYPILLTLAMSLPVLASSHYYQNNKQKSSEQCDCQCSGLLTEGHTRDLSFCQKLLWLEKEFKSLKQGLESRTQHIKELKDLQERVSIQEDYVETLQDEVKELQKELKSKENHLPMPEPLVMRPDDQMLGDSGQDTRLTDTDRELAKNVSDLLAKVEEVENRTSQVQEELRSERRVRRHLEEDLNETRYSIRILDDKLHNVSVSRDVEEVFLSTLENMNKTFFEDHLQKLYYKVDGVVYKNETKQLDKRLDQVEYELQEVNNNTALQMVTLELQALTEEIKALRNLSEAVTEGLVSEDLRIDVLENRTQNFEDVEEQLKTFKNVSNVIQEGVIQFKIDVMDVRNKTKELGDALLQQDNYSSYLNDTLKSVMNNASDEISQLKSELNKSLDLHLELEKELKFVAADVAMIENRVHDLSLSSEINMQDVYRKIDNVTDSMENSMHSLAALLIEMNSKKPSRDDSEHETNNFTTKNESSLKESPCTLPTVNDTHLLVSMEESDEGQQELEFACRPIGRYVLDRPSVPLRCENGQWNGPMPRCLKLLDEKEMEDVSKELKSKNPCLSSSGDSPDPTDCYYFFKCWMGRSERFSCPSMLHFDKITKRCDYPRVANCKTHLTEETTLIVNVIPVVQVDPDNIDKPYGLMGTSDSGHLVVYPRTRFSLNCIFPYNRWGPPKWRVDLFLPNSSKEKEIETKNEQNSVRMTVTADSEEDSGVYSCESPFGKQNSITIVVQAVTCPTVPWSGGISDIVYRPNPDGVYRALTTPVEYVCSSGAKMKGYCMADGKWSLPPPTPEECHSEEFVPQTLWGCPFLHTEGHPNLVLERNDHDTTITFKCAGNTNLIGSTFTRCYHGNWTHQAMPRCLPKRTWN